MSTPEIIPWPDPRNHAFGYINGQIDWRKGEREIYERQRAEAALSRLKVAVVALNRIAVLYDWNDARQALASIGELKGEI